ncbi:hypothetical protein LNP74_22210 [Klebsiella pneumoniae subsp. pneumoniae]|nr:hypothetical protein [Klebsiella pneumoniae subsp. pneumoniae]
MSIIQKICHKVAVMQAGRIVEQGGFLISLLSRSIRSLPVSCSRWCTTACRGGWRRSCSRDNGARALRLEFVGATAQQPIINHLIRECAVEGEYPVCQHV